MKLTFWNVVRLWFLVFILFSLLGMALAGSSSPQADPQGRLSYVGTLQESNDAATFDILACGGPLGSKCESGGASHPVLTLIAPDWVANELRGLKDRFIRVILEDAQGRPILVRGGLR